MHFECQFLITTLWIHENVNKVADWVGAPAPPDLAQTIAYSWIQ